MDKTNSTLKALCDRLLDQTIRSDEGLMLETSASKALLYCGQFTFYHISPFDKT